MTRVKWMADYLNWRKSENGTGSYSTQSTNVQKWSRREWSGAKYKFNVSIWILNTTVETWYHWVRHNWYIHLKKSMIGLKPCGPRQKLVWKGSLKRLLLSVAPVFWCCSSPKSLRNWRVGKKASLASSSMVTAVQRVVAWGDSAWSRKYDIAVTQWRALVNGGVTSFGHCTNNGKYWPEQTEDTSYPIGRNTWLCYVCW